MAVNLIIGLATMAVCLAIQCLFVSLTLDILLHRERKQTIKSTLLGTSALLLKVMLVGNLLQITIWGGVYIACGEFKDFATAFYHSVVNFTTLGYDRSGY